MKARIKETGEIINIAEYARVALDKCDSYGDPIEMSFEDVEILQDKSDDIDWEQRRYEIAKEMMPLMCQSFKHFAESDVGDRFSKEDCAYHAVRYADALIEELKKGGQNEND